MAVDITSCSSPSSDASSSRASGSKLTRAVFLCDIFVFRFPFFSRDDDGVVAARWTAGGDTRLAASESAKGMAASAAAAASAALSPLSSRMWLMCMTRGGEPSSGSPSSMSTELFRSTVSGSVMCCGKLVFARASPAAPFRAVATAYGGGPLPSGRDGAAPSVASSSAAAAAAAGARKPR